MSDKLPKVMRLGGLQIEFTHQEFDLITVTIKSFDSDGNVDEVMSNFINYEDLKELIKFFWGCYIETKKTRDHIKTKQRLKKENDANSETDIIPLSSIFQNIMKNL